MDVSNEHGPTEFFPGSHLIFNENVFHEQNRGSLPRSFANTPAGSAIIFDYRIFHRGCENTSSETRFVTASFFKIDTFT